MNRRRRVFGRVTTTCPATGRQVRIELTRTGLIVRPKYARSVRRIGLPDLLTLASGQGVLNL